MAHKLVTLERKKIGLAPGEAFELPFRPGIAKNMSATADLSEDAYVDLLMLDAAGTTVAQDTISRAPAVNYQPAAVADFRARVINRSSMRLDVVLTVNYYSDEELATEPVDVGKIVTLASQVLRDELKLHVTLEGKHLTITGDHSLVSLDFLKKWKDSELDIPFNVEGLEVDANGISLEFAGPGGKYPNGSVVLHLQCAKPVRLTKYLVGHVDIHNPKLTLRAGLNVYGGSIQLAPVELEQPALDPNLLASLADLFLGFLNDAKATLTNGLAKKVAELAADGTLAKYTERLQRVLHIGRLQNLRIEATNLVLEYEKLPPDQPVPVITSAPAPRSPRLEHLIIVMLENRSFDHMMPDLVAGRNEVRLAPANYSETLKDANGKPHVYERAKTKLHALPQDPGHDSASQDIQAEGGFVWSFLKDHKGSPFGAEVLAYQPREHLPFFEFLAREFVICDDWRAALLGHTWPNRQYSLAAASKQTSKGYRDNPSGDEFEFYTIPTICDVLEAQRVNWAYYKDDFGFLELYRRWVFDRTRIRSRAQFANAIATGALPTVCWYEPNISDFGRSVGNDDHPPISVFGGQRLLADLYAKLCTLDTKNWLLAITYDESGGFYDHMKAELAPDDQPLAAKQGFRVPAFLVSPWLERGKTVPTRFDHTALIRTVLDNFCAPEPIFENNKRVAAANSFATILDKESPYSTGVPREMPKFTGILPAPIAELQISGALEADSVQPQKPLFAAFEAAKQALAAQKTAAPTEATLAPAGLDATAPVPAPAVQFEGLYIETRPLLPELAALGWSAQPWFDNALEARPPAPLAVDVAWDLVHDLRARHPGVVIDPLWEQRFPDLAPDVQAPLQPTAAPPADRHWHLESVNAEAAWKIAPNPGAKILIGHLDTGYREHPDLAPMLLPQYGWDVFRNDNDPHDDLEHGFLKFPGHGTSTASIIGSRGVASDVKGTAPAVTAIPVRISSTVIHLSMANMVRGIQIALERNVHVISLSAGGLWSAALHRAVRDAVAQGVIVVAAAGNYTGIVVWPAAFDEVIACGAINATGATWTWSNGGRAHPVTVMAPGEDVWVLRPRTATEIIVSPGSGTSFATACVAGAIATWLGHHGRDKLIDMYGRGDLARVAKHLVRSISHVGDQAGPLDMVKLLNAPVPDKASVPPYAPATPIDVIEDVIDGLKPSSAGEVPYADELRFRAMVEKLSRRAPGTLPPSTDAPLAPLGVPPSITLPMSARLKKVVGSK